MRDIIQAIILMAALPFTFASCQFLGEEPARSTFVVGTASPPALLHPLVHDQPWSEASALVFSRLYTIDLEGRVVQDLVESDAVSADGRTWTLQLRPNVLWHDGVRLSADDVLFSMLQLFDPNAPAELAQKLSAITEFTPAPPHGVTLHLATPWPDLRQALVELPIIAAHRAQDGNGTMIGTGPYRWVRATGSEVYLERFEEYHGVRPAGRALILRTVLDDDERAREVRDGTLDVAAIKPSSARILEGRADIRRYRLQSDRTILAVLNLARPPMDDARLRRATSQLIDRAAVVANALDGCGAPLLTPIPPGCACRIPPVMQGFDPTNGRELLRAAGFTRAGDQLVRDGKPLTLDILVPRGDPELRRTSEVVSDQLEHEGISTARFLLSDTEYEAARREPLSDYDALLQAFESRHSAANFLRYYLHSRGKGNLMGFHCAEIDQLIDRLTACQSSAEQDQLCQQIQSLLKDEMPVIALASPQAMLVTRVPVTGAALDQPLSGGLGRVLLSLVTSRTISSTTANN